MKQEQADEVLDHLRAKLLGQKVPEPEPFIPPGPEMFCKDVLVAAFDPSLMHTGYVLMEWLSGGVQPYVFARETFDLKVASKGYRATWEAAGYLTQMIENRLETCPYATVGLEAPPVGGGNLRRTDSSLVAGTIIYSQAAIRGMVVLDVSPNHVSSVLVGNVHHDKKEIAAAVARYIPESADWTEGERDGAAVGLTVLHDLRRRDG